MGKVQKLTETHFKKHDEESSSSKRFPYIDRKFRIFNLKDMRDYCIRILPPTWENPVYWGLDLRIHYQIGSNNETFICPEFHGKGKCPICEEDQKQAKAGISREDRYGLSPKKRTLIYLIDIDNLTDQPYVWAMPYTLDQDIYRLAQDKRNKKTIDISDPVSGYYVEFSKVNTGKKFPEYKATRIKPFPVERREWITFVEENPLDEIVRYYTYEEIFGVFTGLPPSLKDNEADTKWQYREDVEAGPDTPPSKESEPEEPELDAREKFRQRLAQRRNSE